jgi:hypothetical protein
MKQTSLAVALVAALTASAINLPSETTETTTDVASLLDNIVLESGSDVITNSAGESTGCPYNLKFNEADPYTCGP